MDAGKRPLVIGLLLGLLVGHWGCALKALAWKDYQGPSEEVRAHLGTIGVVSRNVAPEAALESPTSGKVKGAIQGVGVALITLPPGPGPGILLWIAFLPVAVLGGSIYGAVAAEPASKVRETGQALKAALADLPTDETMRDLVLQFAREQTSHRVVALAGGRADVSGGNYRTLTSEGIDTVLEISVRAIGFVGLSEVSPPLSLIVEACARLVRVADGMELHALPPAGSVALAFATPAYKFIEWGAADARLFREALGRAYPALAETVVEELFLVRRLPGVRWQASEPVAGLATRCPATPGTAARTE